jgi:hypothetical protein
MEHLALLPSETTKVYIRWGDKSGISKNSVKKTVRGNAAELLFGFAELRCSHEEDNSSVEERSDEFNESSVHEKVFSCFIEAGEFFFGSVSFCGQKEMNTPVVVTTMIRKRSTRRDARSTYQSTDALETFVKGKMPLMHYRARMLWRHLSKARCL